MTHCLRRVDEIAYLRWCIRVKDLDLNEVRDEGLGMLAWPSPRLAFDPKGAHDPRRVEKAMPIPSTGVLDAMPRSTDAEEWPGGRVAWLQEHWSSGLSSP